MSTVIRRKMHSAEFKREAVSLVTVEGLSVAQAANDLGISQNMLGRWKKEAKQADEHGTQAFPGNGNPKDAELAQLRRELEVVRRERDILKKAISIFSQPQP